LRVLLRETGFLGVLRESAGKAAGISVRRHGNFGGALAGKSGNHDWFNSWLCLIQQVRQIGFDPDR
jgi:hypothetical protein